MLSIADGLNTNATSTASGGRWYASTVRYILTNGLYAGLAQWYADKDNDKSKISVENAYPATISKASYELAHRRLQALRPGKQLEREIEYQLQHLEVLPIKG